MQQFVRFLMVGVFNTLYGFAVIFACMYWLGIDPYVSNLVGYACGLVTSYVLNKVFTFRSSARGSAEAVRFLIVFAMAYLANLGLLYISVQWAGMNPGLSQIVAGVAYIAVSFVLNKYYVFRHSHPAAR